MTHLNTLAFVSVPKHSPLNPALVRRNRLIDRLEEQKLLVADPTHILSVVRWFGTHLIFSSGGSGSSDC